MYINYNLKKEVGIAMKSKQKSNQLEPVTRNIDCIGYCYNSKPNACTNKALSSRSTGFNPYFGRCTLHIYFIPAKVGIKSCRCATECTCIWLWVITVANTGWCIGISCDWFELVTCLLTFCCNPYFLSQILIFMYIFKIHNINFKSRDWTLLQK